MVIIKPAYLVSLVSSGWLARNLISSGGRNFTKVNRKEIWLGSVFG